LVERRSDTRIAEPCGELANHGTVGVVEVVAGGEQLDGTGSTALQGIEQARVKALGEKDVGRDCGMHPELEGYNRPECEDFV
jgi:hypothetical protein